LHTDLQDHASVLDWLHNRSWKPQASAVKTNNDGHELMVNRLQRDYPDLEAEIGKCEREILEGTVWREQDGDK
jgi:hypothetical protein